MRILKKLKVDLGRGESQGGAAGPATYAELETFLVQQPEPLRRALSLPDARLMLPVDGRGACVLVGVGREEQDKVPPEVTIEWRGRHLIIPLQKDEKYLPATIF
jgi:hypothetical protein